MTQSYLSRSPFILSLILFAGVTLALAVFNLSGYSWRGWAPAYCQPDHCFCEALRDGPVVQPSDTYSNLGFVFVGLLVAMPALVRKPNFRDRVNSMRDTRAYPMVFGVSTVLIGLGSIFYHASMTAWGGWFDVTGMFLLASFILLYSLSWLYPLSGRNFALVYIAANIPLALIAATEYGRIVFAALIIAGIGLEVAIGIRRRSQIETRYFLAAVGSFALAYGIWLLDINGTWCAPYSWLQGHAIWHLLGAAAAWLLYLYYRSERTTFTWAAE